MEVLMEGVISLKYCENLRVFELDLSKDNRLGSKVILL